jgi:hypothetical protein
MAKKKSGSIGARITALEKMVMAMFESDASKSRKKKSKKSKKARRKPVKK